MLKQLYSNFDALDVSFQGTVSQSFLKELEQKKLEAQQAKQESVLRVKAPHNRSFWAHVAPAGVSGGYKYQISTGEEGEIWFIKDAPEADKNGEINFNIRCSVRAFQLARCGIEQTKENILQRARDMGARVNEDDMRISRIDFAIDFLAPDFALDPNAVIARGIQMEKEDESARITDETGFTRFCRKYASVTVGRMPRRQICIYNKRLEVIKKQKNQWWNIWGIEKDDPNNVVWRVELRAGKEYLQDAFNIRTFSDLKEKAGALYAEILENVRYVIPNENDSNASRWSCHEIWKKCKRALLEYAKNGCLGFEKGQAIAVKKEKVLTIYEKMILGMVSGYSEVKGIKCNHKAFKMLMDELEETFMSLLSDKKERAKIMKARTRVRERYVFELGGLKEKFADHKNFATI